MACHEGVSCDVCGQSSFRGPRYKCLRCYDYDLCSACFDAGRISNRHALSHPMQCILTRFDCEVFYMGETVATSEAGIESFTCPFCGTLGFTRSSLATHVTDEHADTETLVICPVCASHPTGDPNYQTPDMGRHLAYDHPPTVGNENEGSTVVPAHSAHLFSRALTGGGSMGLRPARRVGRGGGSVGGGGGGGQTGNSCPTTITGVSTSYTTVTSSSTPSTRGGRARPTSTTTTSGGSENLNSGMDPIAELLSHLHTVRSRAAMPLAPGGGTSSTSNQAMNLQLAQLELQLAETTQAVQMANAVLAGNRAALAGRFSFGNAMAATHQSPSDLSSQKNSSRDASAPVATGSSLKREDVDLMEETSRIDQDLLLAQYLNSVDRSAEELAYQLNRAVFLEELILDSAESDCNVDTVNTLGTSFKWDRPS